MATDLAVHECGCAACQVGEHPEREDHRQLNLLLSRLDEQQRRWVAGREANVWGMVDSNGSRRSPACIPKRSDAVVTNSTTSCAIGRPTKFACPAAGVRASKKRSDSDCRSVAVRRSRNGRQSVFGGKVGAVAAAWVVEEVGWPRLSDDDRPIAARAEVRPAQSPQSAAHGPVPCRTGSSIPAH